MSEAFGSFLRAMEQQAQRIETLEIDIEDPQSMRAVLFFLRGDTELPRLRSLTLSRPHDSQSPPFLETQTFPITASQASWCRLRYLRLHAVPVPTVQRYLLANLTSLEIEIPDGHGPTHQMALYLVTLCKVLSTTTKLEELNLIMTNPLPWGSWQPHGTRRQPVLLPRLTRLRWTFRVRYYNDFVYLFSWLNAPRLRKIDVACFPKSTGPPSLTTAEPGRCYEVHPYSQVESLSVQWPEEVEPHGLFRSVTFPNLKSLHLKRPTAYGPLLPQSTPQLAAICKDPRFPFLESLTLENFALNADDLREVLGWMPALKAVKCISCTGVGYLLDMASGKTTEEHLPGAGRAVEQLKWLQDLAFKSCPDLDTNAIMTVITARNNAGS